MNCKNCESQLKEEDKFCSICGAKIVKERVTSKGLWGELIGTAFNWDNNFFTSIKYLVIRPQEIISEYLKGTRKKFSNPFAFFAIGAALSLLVISQFTSDYIKIANVISQEELEIALDPETQKEIDLKLQDKNISKEEKDELNEKERLIRSFTAQKWTLKYYQLLSFILLPIYALIAFLVFGKPYNYGEHIVINAYIQGILFLVAIVTFILSLLIAPWIHFMSYLITVVYYPYAYGKLYKHNTGDVIKKFLRFLLILIVCCIIILIIGIGVAFMTKFLE